MLLLSGQSNKVASVIGTTSTDPLVAVAEIRGWHNPIQTLYRALGEDSDRKPVFSVRITKKTIVSNPYSTVHMFQDMYVIGMETNG